MLKSLRLALGLAALGLSITSGLAQGASLTVEDRFVYVEAGGYIAHDVVYTAGAENNRVVVAGPLPDVAVVYDPGIPMGQSAGPPSEPPSPPSDPPALPGVGIPDLDGILNAVLNGDLLPVEELYGCVTPTGKSIGICVGTPGRVCDGFSGACSTGLGTFALIRVETGDGSDKVNLIPGTLPAQVASGSGNDRLNTRNKVADHVDCGDGVDTVAADSRDVVAATCENVTRG